MKVQAEVSLYPLRRASLVESIDSFVQRLREAGFSVTVGPMSSHISGECESVFGALAGAFDEAAHSGDVVLTVKVSNACPHLDDSGDSQDDSSD